MAQIATNQDLVQAAQEGDLDAFTRLVEQEKDPLVNYLTYLTGSPDRAEDVAQETFLRFFQMLERYEERGRLRSLLFRIATNLVRKEERRKRRWGKVVPFLLNGHSEDPVAQRKVLQSELLGQLTEALRELPFHYRAPLVLFEVEGWSYSEIASHLDCSQGTVKSRIHRAREKVRIRLDPYFEKERS